MIGSFSLRSIALLGCLFFALFAYAPSGSAQEGSPRGTRAATQEDLEWMKWAGIPNPKVGMSVNPDDRFIGKTVGETKKWLAEHAVQDAKVRCLNPQFAIKLKEFMEAVPGGVPKITSAYRGVNEQQNIINKGDGATRVRTACESYHPWGLAADFNENKPSQTNWMRANAPKYGFNTIGAWDPNHIQWPVRTGQCGTCQADGPDGMLQASASPSSGLASAIRSALGMQPQQPAQQPIASQPLQTGQSPLNAFGTTTLATPIVTGTTTTTPGNSIADRLEDLAFGQQPTSTTQGATSVPLVITGTAIGGIVSSNNQISSTTTPTYSGTPIQQTFTSSDLSWQPTPNTSQSTFQQTLAILQKALVHLLSYLKPFGGQVYAVHGLE